MNWANDSLGAKLVDFSSELPGCEAINILREDVSSLWLSEEGLPQWICVSLENCSVKTGRNNIIIRTIGWYCWHCYTTNPKTVIIHVSKEGSKFKQWDTCTASSQTDSTQRFYCAPINTRLYPYIAFEVTSTFGGLQTYMNNIFLYSDEVPASPALGTIINDSHQFLNLDDFHGTIYEDSAQQQTNAVHGKESFTSNQDASSIPFDLVFSSAVEVSNVTVNDDLLFGGSSVNTEVLADHLSSALGLDIGGDNFQNRAALLGVNVADGSELASGQLTAPRNTTDVIDEVSGRTEFFPALSESVSSLSAAGPTGVSSSVSSLMQSPVVEADHKISPPVFVTLHTSPSSAGPSSTSARNLLQSLSSVKRTLDDLSAFSTSTQSCRGVAVEGNSGLFVREHALQNLLLTSFDAPSRVSLSSERLFRPDSMETDSLASSSSSLHPSSIEEDHSPQLLSSHEGVTQRLSRLEERFSRLLDLMEGSAPPRPPPPPFPKAPIDIGAQFEVANSESLLMSSSELEVSTANDVGLHPQQLPPALVLPLPSEQQMEELMRRVLLQVAQPISGPVTESLTKESVDPVDAATVTPLAPLPVPRSRECALAMGADRVLRRERLLDQLRAEAQLLEGETPPREDISTLFCEKGKEVEEEDEEAEEAVEAEEAEEAEVLLMAESDALDRSVFELLEAKYHHSRRALPISPLDTSTAAPYRCDGSPRREAALPNVRLSIDRSQQTECSLKDSPLTVDASVGTSSGDRQRATEVQTASSEVDIQTHRARSSRSRPVAAILPVCVSTVSLEPMPRDHSSSRTDVLTIQIKSERGKTLPRLECKTKTESDSRRHPHSHLRVLTATSREGRIPKVRSHLTVEDEEEEEERELELRLLARQLQAKVLQRALKAAQLQMLTVRQDTLKSL